MHDARLDQTTRIHAPMSHPESGLTTWHELARPQVHGFDLLAVSFLSNLKFVSIGDEKVARVFEAPQSFVDVVTTLGIAALDDDEVQDRPMRAAVPPLGLSNKAMSDGEPHWYYPSVLTDSCRSTRHIGNVIIYSTSGG